MGVNFVELAHLIEHWSHIVFKESTTQLFEHVLWLVAVAFPVYYLTIDTTPTFHYYAIFYIKVKDK